MINIEKDVKLSKFTTLGIGGPADFLVVVKTKTELIQALEWAEGKKLPFIVLGFGSNVLFADTGFRGLVILNRTGADSIVGKLITVESGANFGRVARETLSHGFVGLHFGAGIPGTVGGAVVGNASALGWDISKTLVSAEIWRHGKVEVWRNKDFNFKYRNSKLKGDYETVLLGATFKLEKVKTDLILKQIQNDKVRRSQSYVGKTCGSYFKNPDEKTSGELIDSLGLKGYRVGDAEVSPLHANVIRNVGEARAVDVLNLEKYIQEKVYNKYKIRLVPEVVKIGF